MKPSGSNFLTITNQKLHTVSITILARSTDLNLATKVFLSGYHIQMANKRRPKKTRGQHYRRYVYGDITHADKDEQNLADKADLATGGQETTLDPKRLLHEQWYGPVWPRSQFQKIDVLCVSLALQKGMQVLPPWQEATYELSASKMKMQRQGLKLPFEIIYQILLMTPETERKKQMLICRALYHLLLPELYAYPKLHSNNFIKFVEMISEHDNKKRFRDVVQVLDLSNVVQANKNSYVTRLLRRFSPSLEIFISSQASFGLSPLVSLRSCQNLKVLDLNLVSETVNLKELFKSIQNLMSLEQLCFPRSSITCEDYSMQWPPNLWYLKLQGGITDEFLEKSEFATTITDLVFAHCPYVTDDAINELLCRLGHQLTRLGVYYPMPALTATAFDCALLYCPELRLFHVTISYISGDLFGDSFLPVMVDGDRPLRSLIIDSPGQIGQGGKIEPDDITVAVCEDRLPCLKSLSLSTLLGWDFSSDDIQDLVSELEYRGAAVYTI